MPKNPHQPSLFDNPGRPKGRGKSAARRVDRGATLPERWSYSGDIAAAVRECEAGDMTREQLASVVGRYVFALHSWEILPVARLIRDLFGKELPR